MSIEVNKDAYRKIIEESKALDRIGRVIKVRAFPSVVKNLGFISPSSPKAKEEVKQRNNIPVLKIVEDTFKTLPSLRHSSYQICRGSPQPKVPEIKLDPIDTKMMWNHDTTVPAGFPFKTERNKRTQILRAEQLFGTERYTSRNNDRDRKRESQKRMEQFEMIYEKIKKRSEKRASESLRYSLEYNV